MSHLRVGVSTKASERQRREGAASAKVRARLQSRAERLAMGKSVREACLRNSHATWNPPANRPDPVSLVLKADDGRLAELLPLRHGRMAQSPFTFYRGSALAMAVDLAASALPPACSAVVVNGITYQS
jgi:hypothetical protein